MVLLEVKIRDLTLVLPCDDSSTVASVTTAALHEYHSFKFTTTPLKVQYTRDSRSRILSGTLRIVEHDVDQNLEVVVENYAASDAMLPADAEQLYREWQAWTALQLKEHIQKLSFQDIPTPPEEAALQLLREISLSPSEEVQQRCVKAFQLLLTKFPQRGLVVESADNICALFERTKYVSVAVSALEAFRGLSPLQLRVFDGARYVRAMFNVQRALLRFSPQDRGALFRAFEAVSSFLGDEELARVVALSNPGTMAAGVEGAAAAGVSTGEGADDFIEYELGHKLKFDPRSPSRLGNDSGSETSRDGIACSGDTPSVGAGSGAVTPAHAASQASLPTAPPTQPPADIGPAVGVAPTPGPRSTPCQAPTSSINDDIYSSHSSAPTGPTGLSRAKKINLKRLESLLSSEDTQVRQYALEKLRKLLSVATANISKQKEAAAAAAAAKAAVAVAAEKEKKASVEGKQVVDAQAQQLKHYLDDYKHGAAAPAAAIAEQSGSVGKSVVGDGAVHSTERGHVAQRAGAEQVQRDSKIGASGSTAAEYNFAFKSAEEVGSIIACLFRCLKQCINARQERRGGGEKQEDGRGGRSKGWRRRDGDPSSAGQPLALLDYGSEVAKTRTGVGRSSSSMEESESAARAAQALVVAHETGSGAAAQGDMVPFEQRGIRDKQRTADRHGAHSSDRHRQQQLSTPARLVQTALSSPLSDPHSVELVVDCLWLILHFPADVSLDDTSALGSGLLHGDVNLSRKLRLTGTILSNIQLLFALCSRGWYRLLLTLAHADEGAGFGGGSGKGGGGGGAGLAMRRADLAEKSAFFFALVVLHGMSGWRQAQMRLEAPALQDFLSCRRPSFRSYLALHFLSSLAAHLAANQGGGLTMRALQPVREGAVQGDGGDDDVGGNGSGSGSGSPHDPEVAQLQRLLLFENCSILLRLWGWVTCSSRASSFDAQYCRRSTLLALECIASSCVFSHVASTLMKLDPLADLAKLLQRAVRAREREQREFALRSPEEALQLQEAWERARAVQDEDDDDDERDFGVEVVQDSDFDSDADPEYDSDGSGHRRGSGSDSDTATDVSSVTAGASSRKTGGDTSNVLARFMHARHPPGRRRGSASSPPPSTASSSRQDGALQPGRAVRISPDIAMVRVILKTMCNLLILLPDRVPASAVESGPAAVTTYRAQVARWLLQAEIKPLSPAATSITAPPGQRSNPLSDPQPRPAAGTEPRRGLKLKRVAGMDRTVLFYYSLLTDTDTHATS